MKFRNLRFPSLVVFGAFALPLHAQLLLTEINSDASGGDYWEITNVGTSSIDLGGFRWTDSAGSFDSAAAWAISAGTSIGAGESIVFTKATEPAFRTWWGSHLAASAKVISATASPGLGQNDGAKLFNSAGTEVFSFSYAKDGFTRPDGSLAVAGHAGVAGGGTSTQALVWDPTSGTTAPRYTAATGLNFNTTASATNAADFGSPGYSGFGAAPPAIALSINATPAVFVESAVNPASVGSVVRTGATTEALIVNLTSSDVSEVTVPGSVTIPAGQSSANFDITAVNDAFPDGSKDAILTATATGAASGSATVTVQDDGDVYPHQLMVTEILSQQDGSAEDFWELTNVGPNPADISGYSWSDSVGSYSAALPKVAAGTILAPGEAILFTAADPAAFRTFWGLSSAVKVAQTPGAPGLGKDDGVRLFEKGGNQVLFVSYAAGGFNRADGTASIGGHAGYSASPNGSVEAVQEVRSMVWVPTSGTALPRYTVANGSEWGTRAIAGFGEIGSPGVTDGHPTVSVGNISVAEGNAGTTELTFAVTRADASTAFEVSYAITGGTATAGTDFTSLVSGKLNFTAGGPLSLPITVSVLGDTLGEPDETVEISLSGVVSTTGTTILGNSVGTGTIVNDDVTVPVITMQPTSTSITSGGVTTFVVAASGSPTPAIQWYRGNPGDVSNPVAGATSPVFVTPTLTANTSFWARATNSGATVDSAAATVTIVPGVTSVDLSTYVRVGRYNLPHPSRDPAPANNLLAEEASGVAYNWDTDTLFVIGDGGQSVTQVTKAGVLVNTMTLALGGSAQGTEFYDPEGITYVGNGQFVFTEERDRQAVKFTYAPGTTLVRSATQTMKLGTTIGNIGLEGLCYDPQTNGFLFVKESGPLGIFQTTIDFNTLTASNGSPTTVNSTNLFDPALAGTLDMSDVFAFSNLPSMTGQPQSGNLLIISQESAKIVNINRAGAVANSLTLVADPGNISIQDQTQEGVVMDRTGKLYVVSEAGGGTSSSPQVWIFAPSEATNQAPAAVALNNAVTSLPENTPTTTAIKVADIAVSDDGLGTNTLTVTGADASFFEITGNALFLKAGTALNHLTKSSYGITVQVDDTAVGNTPDASVNLTLAITAAPTGTASLIISEVASWSSGNSSIASDWFEVTNIGTATADITGWRMDDSGPTFATSVALNGITSIAPGESVIFLEVAGKSADFVNVWFGGTAPAGLQIGTFAGSGVGLSTGGDAVNLFDSAGTIRANVVFGANAPAVPGPFRTFDNAAGANNATITTLSNVGVNGAFSVTDTVTTGVTGSLIGSPGTIAGVTPIITITATDAAAAEDGTNSGTFRVSRSGPLTSPLTANFTVATGAGQATAADFTPAIGTTVVIPSGQAFVDITITPVGDSLVEGNEALTLTLFDTGTYDVGSPDSATVTIADSRFATWLAANGYTSGGMGNDTDGDGFTDGVEFFFNTNPNSGTASNKLPKVVPNGGALQLNFTRLTNPGVVQGELLVSSNLSTWMPALAGFDYTVASAVVNGDETAFTYELPGSGPSAPGTSPVYLLPNTSDPLGASLGGVRVVNEGLVGVGRLSGESVDKFGETQGAASGMYITDWAYAAGQFSGTFNILPDRGYGDGTSNYAARLHKVGFTFAPYYGAGPVAQTQVSPQYLDSTKFTYQDGGKMKFTTGLNPDTVGGVVGSRTGTLFGQTVGMATAANGPGGSQESLLSFDAEAVHLFPDGSGFVSDEYGTYIARFNAAKEITGMTQLPGAAQPFRPAGTPNFDSINAPTNGRRNNQGLEGMSVSPDGTRLFALLQSATVQDTNGTSQQTRNNARLFVYDIAGANREHPLVVGEYVVKLPQIDLNSDGSGADGTAAQSEIVALGATSFLMLPRDGNGLGKGTTVPILFKSVQLVDFASASNILGKYDGVGEQISLAGVLRPEIKAAAAAEIINMLQPDDLAKFGLNTTIPANANTLNEKIEAMALVPDLSTPAGNDFFLFVGNDNDFQSSNVKMLDGAGNFRTSTTGGPIDGRLNAGITNDAMFYVWRLTIDAGGRFFRFEVK